MRLQYSGLKVKNLAEALFFSVKYFNRIECNNFFAQTDKDNESALLL